MDKKSTGYHGGCQNGGYGGRGGGSQFSLHLAQTSGGDNYNAKVPVGWIWSDRASYDNDDSDDSGLGNSDASDQPEIDSLIQ